MDPRLLNHYNQELRYIREMGAEFAKRYPKIANRLDIGDNECADPYVERLLEGFAFLTARIQVKLDAEFPHFTQHLLEMVYPHYLAPTPSMTVVKFEPDLKGGVTEAGFHLPRQTELRSSSRNKGRANCEFRTAHEVMLWPIRLTEADYLSQGEAARYAKVGQKNIKAGIRLRFESASGFTFNQLELDSLSLYLQGAGEVPFQLYELLIGHSMQVMVKPTTDSNTWKDFLDGRSIKPIGFSKQQAMLPYGEQSFDGYRILQEYFALPQRFLFIELTNLEKSVQRCEGNQLEMVILLDSDQDKLEDLVSTENFVLNCTPAVNLFPKRADRIHLSHRSTEHHLVVDKTRPRDYEVYSVGDVSGFGSSANPERNFKPFYSMHDSMLEDSGHAFYTLRRQPTLDPMKNSSTKSLSRYTGSEIFISLVDSSELSYQSDLKQLGVETLCTNRDLPQLMVTGQGKTDFTLEIGAPVDAVHSLVKPTSPKPAYPEGEHAWRLINHLSLNYLTLLSDDNEKGATALRQLLQLYGEFSDASIRKQIEGLLTVESKQIVQRIPVKGPMAFGRGIGITISFDELAFGGAGAFLMGAVLEHFFSKYVSINSFTQTLVKTRERGEIMQWPVRTGTRTLM